ncbi:thiamine phosphate synthase [Bacillus infantis]|jgi:thiamine-phosphate pyrophosphorylase|uniref:thiamine phosphate synthase n=1 Tax=Bacillus infantis TaxID=324767 RepID=UPI0021558744|nr:thiamine phosphate synthase [Bacillus infantis]MCR6611063.1 thiamine phosphate synthase [Bacillus infantis]
MARIDCQTMKELLKVYFIMGSTNCLKNPEMVMKEAIKGGISLFQYREKGAGCLGRQEKYLLAEQLQRLCRTSGIPFIVNDDIELACEIGADGIHIGQDDEPAEAVREKIGDKILGISAHSIVEANEAIRAGADYLGLGPIYPTSTKADAKAVQGMALIQELRESAITIPIVGIGGITPRNARAVVQAGADGVSVITSISQAEDIKEAAESLRRSVTI